MELFFCSPGLCVEHVSRPIQRLQHENILLRPCMLATAAPAVRNPVPCIPTMPSSLNMFASAFDFVTVIDG